MTDIVWASNAASGNFNSTSNWIGGVVPDSDDTAIFSSWSNIVPIYFTSGISGTGIGAWKFEDAAPAYTFNVSIAQFVVLSGAGIINGDNVTINVDNSLQFQGSASLGTATLNSNGSFGQAAFLGTSSAGHATIVNNNIVSFLGDSTGGSAEITNNDNLRFYGTSDAGSAAITNTTSSTNFSFEEQADAGSATIINNKTLTFKGESSAGSATITTNNGATTEFIGNSSAGTARLIANAGGTVAFNSAGPDSNQKIEVGSIEGAGTFDLDFSVLVVGGNNRSTVLSGSITGSGNFSDPSLTKVGSGKLTLTGASSFAGKVDINAGILQVDGSLGSSASTIAVKNGGTLAGKGNTGGGSVDVKAGGTLSPGASAGKLSTSGVKFTSGATFKAELGGTVAGTGHDQLNVTGGVTLGGATLQTSLINGFQPSTSSDQSFIIIANDGADAVVGTFAGLAEGASLTVGGRNLTITYKGDTGNDVVLVSKAAASGGAVINGTDAGDTITSTTAPTGKAKTTQFADTVNGLGGADTIDAAGGDDRISGGVGIDTLTGGAGKDTFVFDSAIKPKSAAKANADIITDFSPADDTIQFSGSIFTRLDPGTLPSKAFGVGSKKPSKDKHVVYYFEQKGELWYDATGKKDKGKGDVLVATLDTNLNLSAADIFVA